MLGAKGCAEGRVLPVDRKLKHIAAVTLRATVRV